MKEDFLHYIWLYKKLDITNLSTSNGEKIEILNFGQYLQTAGPDFFNAQLIIGNQKWAGNIEIHLKSSDWYLHHHETDSNYNNVILHVVWEHDIDIYRKNNSEIPVLELKKYISLNEVNKYNNLMYSKSWINCENQIATVDEFILSNWKERLFFERLERKSKLILELLDKTNNDWDAVLFCLLAKNFGLNTNGDLFFKMANAVPFSIIRKESLVIENIEALFFGISNLLENSNHNDRYYKELKTNWKYLQHKHNLKKIIFEPLQFFKLRPDNFPTIRLSQLASLYHSNQAVFEQSINSKSKEDLYKIYSVNASEYWNSHYNFGKESTIKKKAIAKKFIDLIIINTIIPLRFAYANHLGKDNTEDLIALMEQIKPETNTIIEKFKQLKLSVYSALDSQSILQLKNEYCAKNKCLKCDIGIHLIKN